MAKTDSYNTKARAQILDYLQANRSATLSVGEILDELQRRGLTANRSTVYRYLDKLVAEHIVIKYADASCEKAVFQYAGEGGHCSDHLHLKCTGCGKLIHLDCGFMEEFRAHIREHHAFEIQCEGNILYGLCGECAAKANPPKVKK